jgi:hypothetical protein
LVIVNVNRTAKKNSRTAYSDAYHASSTRKVAVILLQLVNLMSNGKLLYRKIKLIALPRHH